MRWISFLVLFLFSAATGLVLSLPVEESPTAQKKVFRLSEHRIRIIDTDPLDNMPIVEEEGGEELKTYNAPPVEQRGVEFRRFLAPSVKIGVSGASGSGTICYYDSSSNTAYVATCGHLWERGAMSAEEGKRRNLTCKIITWYQNDKKLESTKEYPAKVIFYSYRSGFDTALVTFQPDWVPTYFPIAPVNHSIPTGSKQHSCGCDGGREVAHYEVTILGLQGGDLVTNHNSPRPGRSGGGLMDDNGWYIGTCWGTQFRDGTGKGYFTPLSAIHQYWSQQRGYEFLLRQQPGGGTPARQLPIINRNNPPQKFPDDYIPLPIR